MKALSPDIHKRIYFFGLCVIAIGMPLSAFLMSVGQFILLGNWLLEGNLIKKTQLFWHNKIAVIVASVMVMHLLGLLYTNDIDYAFKDIRIKVPLLALPLFIATTPPLSKQLFNWLMAVFIASVVVGTFISMGVYFGIIHTKHPVENVHDISIFISHIRFSLMICLSVFISAYYFYTGTSLADKAASGIVIVWLFIFLTILNSLTGIVVLVVVTVIILLQHIFTTGGQLVRISAFTGLLAVLVMLYFYLDPIVKSARVSHKIDFSALDKTTALGNAYNHDTLSVQTENGYPLFIYVCLDELKSSWDEISSMKFDGKNKKGEDIKFTLIRYLTSKGLRKDAEAVRSLSTNEIKAIENGIANVNYVGKSAVTTRIMETFWEFNDFNTGGNMNGHSAVMRIEFWKAGLGIFKNDPLIGVGTGDIKNAYKEQYNKMDSPLNETHRLRSHDQYISIAVAFGLIGLIWFLITLVYPFVKNKLWKDYFYFVFLLIAVLSFLNEDTLETQSGVTFFAFFNALFLFGRKNSVKG